MKVKKLQEFLQKNKIDVALFYSIGMEVDPNFYYFTHYAGVGCLVVPKDSTPFLVVPQMEFERATKGAIKNVRPLEKKRFFDCVRSYIKKKKLGTVGIDVSMVSLAAHKGIKKSFSGSKFVDVGQHCRELRLIKTKKEGEFLTKACSLGDGILKKTLSEWKEFKTESDVAAFLRYLTFKKGLDVSFPPIVASGKHGSMAHYEPTTQKLQKGLCVIDFGVKYKGYCSDITRTIGIDQVNSFQKKIYDAVLRVQENSLRYITEEKSCDKIYRQVVEGLDEYAQYFTHGLGHGIGVEIHELPNLKPDSPDFIKKNMFFTVEPGVYIAGKVGVRIEDSVVYDGKVKRLTKLSKELMVM